MCNYIYTPIYQIMKELNQKLAQIQTELKVKKSSYNSFGKYYFRKAEDILEAVKPFLLKHKVVLNQNFSVIVNQGPGRYSGVRIALSVAKGLEISNKVKLFGFRNTDLKQFDLENIEQLLNKKLIEKKLIKPIYLS